MNILFEETTTLEPVHNWLRRLNISYVPATKSTFLDEAASNLLERLSQLKQIIQDVPDDSTDLILTSAKFGEPVNWRHSLFFNARRRFNLKQVPAVCTLIHITPGQLQELLTHFERALNYSEPRPEDYEFPGLARTAASTLFEQGRRGGPILAVERLLQAQSKCLRIILLVGEDRPINAYAFDLVGAYPRIPASDPVEFYRDISLRLITALSSGDVTEHAVVAPAIPAEVWESLSTPTDMSFAGAQLMARNFFTQMVRVSDLVEVPALNDAIASQYTEGCYATWEPAIEALITTVSGSARPLANKGALSEDDLAVVVGVRDDDKGALVRHVEGIINSPPSSEAVEMIALDKFLPRIKMSNVEFRFNGKISPLVPVVRSKLHGHRGVAAYDPSKVEFVPLGPAYHSYPVSCGTAAQADAIAQAFTRSDSLREPHDSRQLVFTILPGHGVFIVEKWVATKRPFQVIWEAMDHGYLTISAAIPQGKFSYILGSDNRVHISFP